MTCLESLSSDLRAGSSILSLASTFFVAQVPNIRHVVAHRYVLEDGSNNIMSDRQNDLEWNVVYSLFQTIALTLLDAWSKIKFFYLNKGKFPPNNMVVKSF